LPPLVSGSSRCSAGSRTPFGNARPETPFRDCGPAPSSPGRIRLGFFRGSATPASPPFSRPSKNCWTRQGMPDVISNTTTFRNLHQIGCLDFLSPLYQLSIRFAGTLGVLMMAKPPGLITRRSSLSRAIEQGGILSQHQCLHEATQSRRRNPMTDATTSRPFQEWPLEIRSLQPLSGRNCPKTGTVLLEARGQSPLRTSEPTWTSTSSMQPADGWSGFRKASPGSWRAYTCRNRNRPSSCLPNQCMSPHRSTAPARVKDTVRASPPLPLPKRAATPWTIL
jgi:hypothetical protein